jgi:hypothetical protein
MRHSVIPQYIYTQSMKDIGPMGAHSMMITLSSNVKLGPVEMSLG